MRAMLVVRTLGVILVSVTALLAALRSIEAAESTLERGAYLASIMDCTGCHTPGALAGTPNMSRALAGSDIGFKIPGVGVFYPPNLTPDVETGLGSWSEEDIVSAVRTGIRPDGRALMPVMPFPSYAALTDEDAYALAAFLRSLAPIRHKSPGPFADGETPTGAYLQPVMP